MAIKYIINDVIPAQAGIQYAEWLSYLCEKWLATLYELFINCLGIE
jgi:hypothetical protein